MRKSDTFINRMQFALETKHYGLEIIWNSDEQAYEAYIIDKKDEPITRYQGKGYGRVQAIADALAQALIVKTRGGN